jgi:hypothetical protein
VAQVKGRNWFIVGLVILLPIACVGSCAIHDNLLESHFEMVTPGMQQQEVQTILGAPRLIQNCTDSEFKPSTRPDCQEVYIYPSWGVPLLPSVWVVWFNADQKAIDKYRFVSW